MLAIKAAGMNDDKVLGNCRIAEERDMSAMERILCDQEFCRKSEYIFLYACAAIASKGPMTSVAAQVRRG